MAATQSSLKIIMISDHNCIRVTKQATILSKMGHEIHLVTRNLPGGGPYLTRTRWDTADDIRAILQAFGKGYIIHVHNEPSYMVQIARESMPDSKIVFDVHDSNYFRHHEEQYSWYEEDTAAHLCDGMVFVSDECRKRFMKVQGVKVPYCVLPSASPKRWSRIGPWNWMGGLVSQGGHVAPNNEPMSHANRWRDYTELYKELTEKGVKTFAYSAEFGQNDKGEYNDITAYYASLGATPGIFNHNDMLDTLGCHDWSLCGNLGDSPVWDYAIPNKFFDALSAGVPIMNLNCKPVEKWIERYDIGVNVSSVDEMIKRWPEHRQKRANVFKNRHHLYMEAFIPKLLKLYEKI
jgi:hypothetical protein